MHNAANTPENRLLKNVSLLGAIASLCVSAVIIITVLAFIGLELYRACGQSASPLTAQRVSAACLDSRADRGGLLPAAGKTAADEP